MRLVYVLFDYFSLVQGLCVRVLSQPVSQSDQDSFLTLVATCVDRARYTQSAKVFGKQISKLLRFIAVAAHQVIILII